MATVHLNGSVSLATRFLLQTGFPRSVPKWNRFASVSLQVQTDSNRTEPRFQIPFKNASFFQNFRSSCNYTFQISTTAIVFSVEEGKKMFVYIPRLQTKGSSRRISIQSITQTTSKVPNRRKIFFGLDCRYFYKQSIVSNLRRNLASETDSIPSSLRLSKLWKGKHIAGNCRLRREPWESAIG